MQNQQQIYLPTIPKASKDCLLLSVQTSSLEAAPIVLSVKEILVEGGVLCPFCARGCKMRPSTAAKTRNFRTRPGILALLTYPTLSMREGCRGRFHEVDDLVDHLVIVSLGMIRSVWMDPKPS